MSSIDPRDLDHFVRNTQKIYSNWEAVGADRLEQENLADIARRAAEARFENEIRTAQIAAEDLEIDRALESGRMVIEINGNILDAKSVEDILCPKCEKFISYMHQTTLAGIHRADLHGEDRVPLFNPWNRTMYKDTIPAGEGIGIAVCSPTLLYQGAAVCPNCNAQLALRIEVGVLQDGKRVEGIRRKRGRPRSIIEILKDDGPGETV